MLTGSFSRRLNCLRVFITDTCNLNKTRCFYVLLLIAALPALWTCTPSARIRPDSHSSISISWEFRSINVDGEPHTEVLMIVNGKYPQRHPLGLFYGDVVRILKPEVNRREMGGGALSGFITGNKGRGEEVLVRFNEYLNRLIIVTRQIVPGSEPGSYKTLKNIPVYKQTKPDAGF